MQNRSDIIQIFIEESLDELSNLLQNIDAWQNNGFSNSIAEGLKTSFIKLKDNADLVDYIPISELSQSALSLLDTLLSQDVKVNKELFNLFNIICNSLPDLIDSCAKQTKSTIDYVQIKNEAIQIEKSLVSKLELKTDSGVNLDDELTNIFIEESNELTNRADGFLKQLSEDLDNIEIIKELKRALHTLKGSAKMLSLEAIGNLSHKIEDVYTELGDKKLQLDNSSIKILERSHDHLAMMLSGLHDNNIIALNENVISEINSLLINNEDAKNDENKKENNQKQVPASVNSSFDDELLEIFIEEACEIIERMNKLLFTKDRHKREILDYEEIKRELHTLKGSARMVGINIIGDLSHELESVYTAVDLKKIKFNTDLFDILMDGHDALILMVEQVKSAIPVEINHGALKKLFELQGKTYTVEVAGNHKVDVVQSALGDVNKSYQEMIRVHPAFIESMVNLASENNINRSRISQQNDDLMQYMSGYDLSIGKIKNKIRQLEINFDSKILFSSNKVKENSLFDPLEMDYYNKAHQQIKSISEIVNDLYEVEASIYKSLHSCSDLLKNQRKIHDTISYNLMSLRMVAFETLVPRIDRVVRQVSNELGKEVKITFSGVEEQIDRYIANRLVPVLDHMIRNSIDHGIEDSFDRKGKNKTLHGNIKIEIKHKSGDFLLNISDDGIGLNKDLIYKKALESGLINKSINLNDHQMLQLILKAGFSTSKSVTQISGRGVGLDVVATEIKSMGGSIDISSTKDVGTTFYVKLPVSLAINHAIKVTSLNNIYAIPSVNIEGVTRIRQQQIIDCREDYDSLLEYSGDNYHLVYLSELLGIAKWTPCREINKLIPVVLIRVGVELAAIFFDELLGNSEILIKPLPAPINALDGISGTTILGDGEVALILDMQMLLQIWQMREFGSKANEFDNDVQSSILVVDDSITIRELLRKLLSKNNYIVHTAKDGVDAQMVMEEFTPDLILLDVEMPRMDGFELAKKLRINYGENELPIVMLTSRTGEKHRKIAQDLNINGYLAKPYNDEELLQTITSLIKNDNSEKNYVN